MYMWIVTSAPEGLLLTGVLQQRRGPLRAQHILSLVSPLLVTLTLWGAPRPGGPLQTPDFGKCITLIGELIN